MNFKILFPCLVLLVLVIIFFHILGFPPSIFFMLYVIISTLLENTI